MLEYKSYKISTNPYMSMYYVHVGSNLVPAKTLAAARFLIDGLIQEQLTVKLTEPEETFHE
jgi:hypothetical protein